MSFPSSRHSRPPERSRSRAYARWRAFSAHNPLALDIADALVRKGGIGVAALHAWLIERGIERVRVIDHEDDLPEVGLLLEWAWPRLAPVEHRALAVLAHSGGDHIDAASLAILAKDTRRREGRTRKAGDGLARLRAWHLIQEPLPGRYALHAVVRYAVLKRTQLEQRRTLAYYLDMLEQDPQRLDLEQTHLYAAMDYAHTQSKLDWMLRIERLLATFDAS